MMSFPTSSSAVAGIQRPDGLAVGPRRGLNNVNFASMRLETADLVHKDKYGFQQDDVTTFDAF